MKNLPNIVILSDIMYHFYVREKIFREIKTAEEDRVVLNKKVKEFKKLKIIYVDFSDYN